MHIWKIEFISQVDEERNNGTIDKWKDQTWMQTSLFRQLQIKPNKNEKWELKSLVWLSSWMLGVFKIKI